MKSRSKAVSATALCTFMFAAFGMGGMSLADENVPTASIREPVSGSVSLDKPQEGLIGSATVFGAPKEVIQPLPQQGEQVPGADRPGRDYGSLAAMVDATVADTPLDAETRCLATAVFYEARSESLEGQLAVARVIINRAQSSRFGDSICGVVRQPRQFSFVRHGVIPTPDTGRQAWKTSVAVSRIAQQGGWDSKAEGALYFHARRVSPGWSRQRVAVIDNHIFYR